MLGDLIPQICCTAFSHANDIEIWQAVEFILFVEPTWTLVTRQKLTRNCFENLRFGRVKSVRIIIIEAYYSLVIFEDFIM